MGLYLVGNVNLIPWEDKAVGIKILNIFILNLLFHIKGPKEIKCGVMFASNNYHSIRDTVKNWKKTRCPLMGN